MDNTNLPEGSVRVIWEILPGEGEQLFREINQDDIDSSLFYPGLSVDDGLFPMIPHPVLIPEEASLDRVWNQTVIKFNYQPGDMIN